MLKKFVLLLLTGFVLTQANAVAKTGHETERTTTDATEEVQAADPAE